MLRVRHLTGSEGGPAGAGTGAGTRGSAASRCTIMLPNANANPNPNAIKPPALATRDWLVSFGSEVAEEGRGRGANRGSNKDSER